MLTRCLLIAASGNRIRQVAVARYPARFENKIGSLRVASSFGIPWDVEELVLDGPIVPRGIPPV